MMDLIRQNAPVIKALVVLVFGIGVGFFFNWFVTKIWGVSATKIKEDAKKEAEHTLREAKVASKAEMLKLREELDKEMKDRKSEMNLIEKRLVQREENLEKKSDSLDSRSESISRTENELKTIKERLSNREVELKREIAKQISELERISQMDQVRAKEMLLEKIKGEVQNESGQIIRNIVDESTVVSPAVRRLTSFSRANKNAMTTVAKTSKNPSTHR